MHLRRFSFLLAPACVAWIGCAGGEPGNSPELNEGPSSGTVIPGASGDGTWMGEALMAGCETDGGTPTGDTVLVTSSTHYHTAVGVVVRPNDLSARQPEILVPNGATFTRLTGSAAPDGGWRFTGVPSGAYYLKTSSTGATYIVTDERQVELGSNLLGRADAGSTSYYDTPAQVNLSGLSPWQPYRSVTQPGSSLQVVSGQVNLAASLMLESPVTTGQTSLVTSEARLSAVSGYALPVLDGDVGDRLYVNQLGEMDAGTLPDGGVLAYSAVVRGVQMSAFDFTPNGTTPMPITGVMQPVPMSEFTMEWRLPEYTARASEVHPQATAGTPTFSVVPAVHGLTNGWIGYSGELLNLRLPSGSSSTLSRRLKYGNPFPTTWGVVGTVRYSFRVMATPPGGGTTQYLLQGGIGTYERLDNLIAGPVLPRVTPPRGLSIDGIAATVAREVGSTSPVIAWLPPAVGSPSAYWVTLYRFPAGRTTASVQAQFYVPGSVTQVRLPPGTLAPASLHYLKVTAVDAPDYNVERDPFISSERIPNSQADALSSLFTTP
ncbi:hypothetical protein HPC49_39975 [Pyxidicoccus fallax]|uniref:Lipoprotein n=1 Tax=Pyxidicoccus fallax TaxID=394095 RepID=A0A848LXV1_9BACT|nr:hypothetical protein [Pyxidicoccus fallax]NMO22441.1 hypothetical protein [Pyxidicoccus fallax]NPC84378.1 hypothetical protein [Pyxidicoccus fallax]